jgi:UDP-N-acetylmuramate dehydrogenase
LTKGRLFTPPFFKGGVGVDLLYNSPMDIQKVYSDLKTNFPNSEIYQNHLLAPYTTVKIGGPADVFIHTKSSDELKNILEFIYDLQPTIYPTIIGNGSNVLISDSGIRGIVIKNSSNKIEILPNNKVKVDSGVQLPQLINFTLDHNLLGLEEFAYIPSTIGGAIAGNIHGNDKHLFSQFVKSVEYFGPNPTIYDLRSTILSAILQLTPEDSTSANKKLKISFKKNLPFNQ